MARLKKTKEPEKATPSEDPAKPKARVKARMAGEGVAFDIWEQENLEATKKQLANAKVADGFKSLNEIRRDYIPIRHLAFQWLIGRIGFPINTLIDIIGQENLGKSSLAMSIIGYAISNRVVSLYMNTEAKMLESEWAKRLLDPSREMGDKIMNVMESFEHVDTLDEMDRRLKEWLHIKRFGERPVPMAIPLLVIVDTASKLLNSEEAAQLAEVKEKNPLAGINDISAKPGVTAKWWHNWTRGYPALARQYNATVILINAQNTKMDAGAMTAFAPDGGASMNKTKTGGRAVDQSAAFQITVTRRGKYKSGDKEIGTVVKLRCVKNSYGSNVREILYNMRTEDFIDNEDTVQQALELDEAFCNIMVDRKILGTTVASKKYTCAELGIFNAKASRFYAELTSNPDHTALVCAKLGIAGYEAM